jgi:hypothetical protein
MGISKLDSKELQEKFDNIELPEQSDDDPGQPFFWADEDYMQKAVKIICTNYDLG